MNSFLFIIFLQVILESLPISSSGHVRLFLNFFKDNITEAFECFLHGPTIIVLMAVFYKSWTKLFLNLFRKKQLIKIFFKIILLLFAANSVTALVWFLLKNKIKMQAWFSSNITLLIGFCVTAFLLLLLKLDFKKKLIKKSYFWSYCILGLVQGLALFPGVSRFASVYSVANILGFSNKRAFQITFLLQFPLIFAAFIKGTFTLIKEQDYLFLFNIKTLLTIVLATIISIYVLNWCKKLAKDNKLWRFAFYMLFPIAFLIFFITR